MKKETRYSLLTFYKFVDIENPKAEVKKLYRFTRDIGLRGRIFIGEEGINATVTGNIGQVHALMLYLENNQYFKDIPDIEAKATEVDEHKFPKMIVRYRKEIVALGEVYSAAEIEKVKSKMSVEEFKKVMDEENDDYLILDMRNNYEYKLGHFKNAIPAGTVNFRDLQSIIDHYKEQFDNKKIVMYCTGGIRCEKVAVYLDQQGFEDVKQLDGGVMKYVNKYKDGNWLGNLYTFDDRVSTDVGDENTTTIISECHYTGEKAKNYYNCRYGPCNAQIIAKPKQYRKHMGFCSEQCANRAKEDILIRDVKFDPLEYKQLRGKIKQDNSKREEVVAGIAKHIEEWLRGAEFNHKTPVEEEIVLPEVE
ncbi:MAG: rhodanese-related sulfurtransferase [Chlorobiota bacterium]